MVRGSSWAPTEAILLRPRASRCRATCVAASRCEKPTQCNSGLGLSSMTCTQGVRLSLTILRWLSLRSRPVKIRSEEHTSELQSLMRISYAVFCLNTKRKLGRHTQITRHLNTRGSCPNPKPDCQAMKQNHTRTSHRELQASLRESQT